MVDTVPECTSLVGMLGTIIAYVERLIQPADGNEYHVKGESLL